MEKDERIMRIEKDVKELTGLHIEIDEKKVLLEATRRKMEESKARSDLYSKLEKVSGVRILPSEQTACEECPATIEQKIVTLSNNEVELKKRILTSVANKSSFPFGIGEATKHSGCILFPTKENFRIESGALEIIFDLIDMDYPAKSDGLIIDENGITVETENTSDAVSRAVETLEKIRNTARTLSLILFDEDKLRELCEIIHSSEKSYRPVVEEIGNHYPNPISAREIAKNRNMQTKAVASITSMLIQGKNWSGKCSILKRKEGGVITFNSLGTATWNLYERQYALLEGAKEQSPEERPKELLNFSEE